MPETDPSRDDMGMWTALRLSLQEYIRRVQRRGWAVIVTGIGGVLGLIAVTVPAPTVRATPTAPAHPSTLIPTWLWLSLLLGGIMVAQFLAFHDVRKERDEARDDLRKRLNAVRYRFQMVGLNGGPGEGKTGHEGESKPIYWFWLTFMNGSSEPLQFQVESLSMQIGGHADEASYDSKDGIILPGGQYQFHCPWIEAPTEPLLVGVGEYTVLYRHASGGPQFRTHHRFAINWIVKGDEILPRWLTQGTISHDIVDGPTLPALSPPAPDSAHTSTEKRS